MGTETIDASTPQHQRSVRLVGAGKLWGELRIEDGRLLLDARRNGRHVQFDLLATVQQNRAVCVSGVKEGSNV